MLRSGLSRSRGAYPAGLCFQDLWGLHDRLDSDLIPIAFRALHLLDWLAKDPILQALRQRNETQGRAADRECLVCGYQSFPRISPAVIVLVERDNRCLLASSPPLQRGFLQRLAGFAEPGETLEETVAREVREETGIEVTDIRYFPQPTLALPRLPDDRLHRPLRRR